MGIVHKVVASRKIRFGLVGIANTAFNFVVLDSCFYLLHQSKIVSSVIATLCAVTISFFLNRNFVFRHRARSLRQPIMFAVVTLTGVLLVQNVIYAVFVGLLKNRLDPLAHLAHSITGVTFANSFLDINVSNLIASAFAMVWNYNGYRWFVFTESGKVEEDEIIVPA